MKFLIFYLFFMMAVLYGIMIYTVIIAETLGQVLSTAILCLIGNSLIVYAIKKFRGVARKNPHH
jgi:hypothetical membrane protein